MKHIATRKLLNGIGRLQVCGSQCSAAALSCSVVHRHTSAETSEALAFTKNGQVHGGLQLDRERKVGRKLSYRIVGPPDRELVHGLLYSSYHPDEPLTKALGLARGNYSIPDADRLVDRLLAKHLTVLAEDQETGQPVGVAVNNVCQLGDLTHAHQEEELEACQDPRFKPVLAIRHKLRLSSLHIYTELDVSQFFSIRMVGVAASARGQGVATDLIRRSVLLAGCLGYVGINAIATGTFAKEAFQNIGLLPATTINYTQFTFQGERVFQGVPSLGGEEEMVLLKKKFFQSALKHIL